MDEEPPVRQENGSVGAEREHTIMERLTNEQEADGMFETAENIIAWNFWPIPKRRSGHT